MSLARRAALLLPMAMVLAAAAHRVPPPDTELRALRDEALEHIGWAAGNGQDKPIWPEIKGVVEKDGPGFNYFANSSPLFEDQEMEAFQNTMRYLAWRNEGAKQPYDETEIRRRVDRALDLMRQLEELRQSRTTPKPAP